MNIWYCHYSLSQKEKGGVHQSHEGLLFKFQFNEGIGYSLYHPINSLKDRSLSEIKKGFQDKNLSDLTCLRIKDSAQRVLNFFNQSHQRKPLDCYFSAGALSDYQSVCQKALSIGFEVIKIKIEELGQVPFHLFKEHNLKLILDFNSRGSKESLDEFSLSEFADVVLYLEDPPSFNSDWNIDLASDFEPSTNKNQIEVIKPTCFERAIEIKPNKRQVFTSYLDHPLGQLIAALHVPENNGEFHGLLTQHFYEPNKYSELLSAESFFKFDFAHDMRQLLEKEKWVPIKE